MDDHRLHITIDLAHYLDRYIDIEIVAPSRMIFQLEAHRVANQISVEGLSAHFLDGDEVVVGWDNGRFLIAEPREAPVRIHYTLHSAYDVCVGADTHHAVVYPFINEHEVFLGTGCLPYPTAHFGAMDYDLTVANLPDGFSVFTSLLPSHPEKLSGFFWYAARGQTPHSYSVAPTLALTYLAQHDQSLMPALVSLQDLLTTWMTHLIDLVGPPRQTALKVLALQAPPGFQHVANGRTFATGENFLGGIAIYGPDDPSYLYQMFGHSHYERFLRDGMVHELGHLYLSSTTQTEKSLVYADPDAPQGVRSVIGEALIGYLHAWYLHVALDGDPRAFLEMMANRWEAARHHVDNKIRWLLADVVLRRDHQATVWDVFQHIVTHHAGPFRSIDPLIPYPDIIPLLGKPLDSAWLRHELAMLDPSLLNPR